MTTYFLLNVHQASDVQAAIQGMMDGTIKPEDVKVKGIDSEEEKLQKEVNNHKSRNFAVIIMIIIAVVMVIMFVVILTVVVALIRVSIVLETVEKRAKYACRIR